MIAGIIFFPGLLVINPLLWLQSSADLFAVRERINESQLNHPTFAAARQPSALLSPGVHWADLAAIQSQLQIQSQVRHYGLFTKARCVSPSIWCLSSGYNTSKHSGFFIFSFFSAFCFKRQLSPSHRDYMMWKRSGGLRNVKSRSCKVINHLSVLECLNFCWANATTTHHHLFSFCMSFTTGQTKHVEKHFP